MIDKRPKQMTTEEITASVTEWANVNRPRLLNAKGKALLRLDGIAEMCIDEDTIGEEKVKEKVTQIIIASNSVYADYLSEEMGVEFSDVDPTFLLSIIKNTKEMVLEQKELFIEDVVRWYLNRNR